MRGTFKTVQSRSHSKTNFNDWSDPNCKCTKRTTRPKYVEVKEYKDNKAKGKEEESQSVEVFSSISDTSLEINQLRQKIKDGYPLLTQKEIRIIKLPYYESLLLNILEDGFIATHQFITDLILMDEAWHKQRNKSSSMKNRLFLKSNVAALNVLCNGLTKAEVAKLEKNKTEELRLLLGMAIFFSSPEQDSWHWLSTELYEQCMAVLDDTEDNFDDVIDEELIAIAQYLYASFLLDVHLDPERAKPLVEKSMKLSEGKFWKVSNVTGHNSDIIYLESSLLLHKIYLVMALQIKESNIEEAIKFCRHSLFWAKQINCQEAEGTALLNLVIIYIEARKFDMVLSYLDNFMSLCIELQDVHGLCEGYILKSEYHEQKGEDDLVIIDIEELLKIAEENSILQMMAIAHHKLALFYLIQGNEKEMRDHAVKAYEYYVILNSKSEIDETRCLTGITQAREIMPQYLSLILESESIDSIEFHILTLWKSLHIPFFSNVKLFHPEASVNGDLKDRMESTKNEEIIMAHNIRQTEMLNTISMVRIPSRNLRRESSVMSTNKVSKVSRSVIEFKRQMRSDLELDSASYKSKISA